MKGILLCLGALVATLVLVFIELVTVMATTGKSISAGERGVMILAVVYIVTYLISCVATGFGVVKLEPSMPLRVIFIALYAVLLGAAMGFFGFLSLIMFNR